LQPQPAPWLNCVRRIRCLSDSLLILTPSSGGWPSATQSRTHQVHNNGPMSDLTIDTFERLETAMWTSLVEGDGSAADRLLSSDYLGVYTTGFSDRADYIAALANGPIAASFEISKSRIFVVSDTAVMYSYRAHFKSRQDGPTEVMYISSLWCNRSDGWVNVFSQDTPGESSSRPADATP
jgi:hypothetical protein